MTKFCPVSKRVVKKKKKRKEKEEAKKRRGTKDQLAIAAAHTVLIIM